MKRLTGILISCLFWQTMYGLPLGNPTEPNIFVFQNENDCPCYDIISLGIGFYGDYVYERHLETVTDHDIDHTSLYTNAAYLVVSILEEFDIFSTLGATRINFNTSLGPFNAEVFNPHPRFDFQSGSNFSWSIGSRALLWECGPTSIGIEGQYFTTNASLSRLSIRTNVVLNLDETKARYSEWQIGAGISHRVNIFVPYIGIKYSRAFWDFGNQRVVVLHDPVILHNQRSQKNWGYAVGITLSPFECEKIAITVEGRFADEKAVHVNGQIRF